LDDSKRKHEELTRYELAGAGSRIVAFIIDMMAAGFLYSLSSSLLGASNNVCGFNLLLYFLYFWLFWTQRDGQTPGKMLMKIKVIRMDGQPLSAGDSVLRFVAYFLNMAFGGLGFIWAFFDLKNQGWHDKIARTYVVHTQSADERNKYVIV
jgi:uncharacterized RDD family membrane protein YckC